MRKMRSMRAVTLIKRITSSYSYHLLPSLVLLTSKVYWHFYFILFYTSQIFLICQQCVTHMNSIFINWIIIHSWKRKTCVSTFVSSCMLGNIATLEARHITCQYFQSKILETLLVFPIYITHPFSSFTTVNLYSGKQGVVVYRISAVNRRARIRLIDRSINWTRLA